jgi:hypothetical protein
MASWVLTCRRCHQRLAQFNIEDNLENLFEPAKPDFPSCGKEFECPNCGQKTVYERTDLLYEGIGKSTC